MNCLEFRRRIESQPNDEDNRLRAHVRSCEPCAAFAAQLADFDHQIKAALAVPIPEKLAARILLRQSFETRSGLRRWRRHGWVAFAASLLVAVTVGLAASAYLFDEVRLEHEVVALVNAASYALESEGPVSGREVTAALEPVGLAMETPLASVSFAGRCLVRGKLAGHLVLRQRNQPVSVFLMPEERVARRAHFAGGQWTGVLLPAEHGAIAIVAPPGVPVEGVADRIIRAVRWPA